MTDTRAAIIKACADRQAIYEAKRSQAFEQGNDDRFDEFTTASEVCTYLLADILRALDMAPAEIGDGDRIKAADHV